MPHARLGQLVAPSGETMKRNAAAVAALLPVLFAQAQGKAELKPSEIYSRSIGALCTVIAKTNGKANVLGSGFVISGDGSIATNRHVVEGASEVLVKCGTLEAVRATVADTHKTADLALLRTNLRISPPLVISSKDPTTLIGQPVYVIGNPEGLEGTISNGLVSGVRHKDGETLIQISAPISHGSSGGPVLLGDGQVVGVATALLTEGQNLNFATPAALLLRMDANPESTTKSSERANGGSVTSAPSQQPEPTSEDLGTALLSRRYWSTMDWDHLEEDALVRKISAVVTFDPTRHQLGDRKVVRQTDLPVGGMPAEVMELVSGRSIEFPRGILLRAVGVTPEFCRSFSTEVETKLGPPSVAHDLSYPGKDLGATILRKQWDIPPSRVSWECTSFSPDDRRLEQPIGWMALIAGHQSTEPKDTEITWIRCVVSIQITSTDFNGKTTMEPPRALPDIVLGLDDYKRQVLDEANRPLGKAEFTDGRIRLVMSAKDRSDEMTIDRRAGRYNDSRIFANGSIRAATTGSCEKIDRKKMAF